MCSSSTPQTTPEALSFGEPWPDLNDGLLYTDVVSPRDSESTLIQFYSSKYKNSAPLQGWLQRIHNGQITVDGTVVTQPDTVLRSGSQVIYRRLPWREPDAPFMLQVLYEDDDVIALNKPSGLQVLPGGFFQQRTVLTQLHWRASKKGSSLANQELMASPVHRLGRGTSGILLCAKTKIAKTQLAAYFANGTSLVRDKSDMSTKHAGRRKITKIYRALAYGIIKQDKIIINQPIGTVRYPGVAKGLYVASPSGKAAMSKVEVIERDEQHNHTFVQVEIESGRPHQIRIHMAFIGHPLLGDPLYAAGGQPNCSGSEFSDETFAEDGGYQRPANPVPGDCGYFLHAHKLVLCHPISNEVMAITAPLPPILRTKAETNRPE